VTDSTIIKTVLALGLLAGKCVPGPDPDPGPVKDAGVDVQPDVSPDVAPDLAPDLAPDAAPDLTPDAGVEVTPDAAPDLAPDVVQRSPVVIPASANTTMMIYPTAGDESGCTDEGGPRYLLTVTGAGACVPAALEPLNPVILLGIQRCQTGAGCVPCTDDSCLPRSCFQPFPQAGPGDCAYELPVIEGDRTHYLFFPNVDADNPPPQRTGLPFLVRVTKVNDSVSILPPHDRPFLVGRLRQEPYFRDEVAEAKCGDDLCGIFLFAPPPSGLSWFFGASISNNLALW
jgi:hypothetical protein